MTSQDTESDTSLKRAVWIFDKFPTVEVEERPDPRHNASISGPVEIILRYTNVDPYHAAALKAVAKDLPKIINTVRNEAFSERVKHLVEAYKPLDQLADIRLGIIQDGQRTKRLVVQTTPMLDSNGIGQLLKISGDIEEIVNEWKQKGKLFSVTYGDIELFPAFQFHSGELLSVIETVLSIFHNKRTSWEIAIWFACSNSWLDGKIPMDCLVSHANEIVDAAEQEVAPLY